MPYRTRSFGFGSMLTPVVKRLLIANVAAFAVTLLVGHRVIDNWFAFEPTRIFIRPWGVFTYMFVHGGVMHILMNMLMLFFFGPPLEGLWGGREFFKYYVICGLGGAALSFIFLPAPIIGASAAIYGLLLAFAMNWPDAPIYVWGIFPVKAKWLVAFFFAISLLSAFDSGMGGGIAHLAHVGGVITGFIYLKTGWRASGRMKKISTAVRRHRFAIVPHDEADSEAEASNDGGARSRPRKEDQALYDAVDRVLDKISAEGMSSLTPDELELLDQVSRKHRAN